MIVFHKKSYLEDTEVKIAVNSPGFQYGMGFFTSLKFIDGQAQFLNYHLERIYHSCRVFNIPFNPIDINKIIENLMKKNNLLESRIKLIIYVDEDLMGQYLIIPQNLIINKYEKNLDSVAVDRGDLILNHHKSLNYFDNIRMKNTIRENFDDLILFSKKGQVLEATTSNIFFLDKDTLYTPPLNLPILNGIIRRVILESQDIRCVEKEISMNEIIDFAACFLTNSIKGIIPVKSIVYKSKRMIFNCENINKLPSKLLML
ncbi:MAG: aminotransferase class IV [Candidatus Marinimicrobia bacterium]|nr:aminotransferase class IV [Candidatus Neomarinimicrobiota bacterium]